ncbi:hypothetical protein [Actinomadura algeriensis]|uniref:hypothetical protein n=1 Tax=Actinomadura algeriensis TaxID=1679523 RepID=UPI00178AEBE9|nr:hypothetical protein [Actinomadura algeriensis]
MRNIRLVRARDPGQRDLALGDVRPLVVADLQAERLEQPSEQRLGGLGKIHLPCREQIQQFRTRALRLVPLDLCQFIELGVPLGRQCRRPLSDVAYQVAVTFLAMLQVAEQTSPAGLDVVDLLP